jgi:hypothetical protein
LAVIYLGEIILLEDELQSHVLDTLCDGRPGVQLLQTIGSEVNNCIFSAVIRIMLNSKNENMLQKIAVMEEP